MGFYEFMNDWEGKKRAGKDPRNQIGCILIFLFAGIIGGIVARMGHPGIGWVLVILLVAVAFWIGGAL